jgi:hypothetical protein
MSDDKTKAQYDVINRKDLPLIGGVYQHYKGNYYQVVSICIDENTSLPRVVSFLIYIF